MDIDPPGHEPIEAASAPVEQPISHMVDPVPVPRNALEDAATADTVKSQAAIAQPATASEPLPRPAAHPQPPPHKPYRPQFAVSAAAILQRMHQPAAPTCTAAPSATMAMPPPSPPRPETPTGTSTSTSTSASTSTSTSSCCSACRRAASSLFNPLVPCRRCAVHWHRLCYEPAIPDYAAAAGAWTCLACVAAATAGRLRRTVHTDSAHVLRMEAPPASCASCASWHALLDRAAVQKQKQKPQRRASWAHRAVDERRAHVAGLAPRDMAYWLLRAVEQYPDFAMFPADDDAEADDVDVETDDVKPEVVVRAPQYRNGIINSIRKSQTAPTAATRKVPRRIVPATVSPPPETPPVRPLFEATPADPDDDPTGLMDGWPRPGRGLYAAAGPDWQEGRAVLADSSDHASFSSIVYDETGRRVRENGMPLLVL